MKTADMFPSKVLPYMVIINRWITFITQSADQGTLKRKKLQYSPTTTSHYHALSHTQSVTHAKELRLPQCSFACLTSMVTYCI